MHDHCESIREMMTGFVVGELDAKLHDEVEAHCADCSACRAELKGLRAVSALLERELTAESVSLELSSERRTQLTKAAQAKAGSERSGLESVRGILGPQDASKRRTGLRWAIPLAAAAMLLLVFSFGLPTDRDSLDKMASVPKEASPAPQEQALPPQDDPAIDPASLSTYGLIVPVARDLEAERRSLIRIATAREVFANYEYPPAYGLPFDQGQFERAMPYFGLDGPAPYFEPTDMPMLAM